LVITEVPVRTSMGTPWISNLRVYAELLLSIRLRSYNRSPIDQVIFTRSLPFTIKIPQFFFALEIPNGKMLLIQIVWTCLFFFLYFKPNEGSYFE
jgi:hypothetical protein